MRTSRILESICSLMVICCSSQVALADGMLFDATQPVLAGRAILPTETRVEVDIQGQIATTQAELRFEASLGGRYRFMFPVPDAASVVGFAIRGAQGWQEAELSRDDATVVTDVTGGQAQSAAVDDYIG